MSLPIIALDMDGVLSDIEHGIQERFGYVDLENERSKVFKQFLPEYVEHQGFEHERPCKNAHKLVEHLTDCIDREVLAVTILTSTGQFYLPTSEVIFQKKKFLEKNFPSLSMVPFCATTSGAQKAEFAHSRAFLVDDHLKNCEKFIKAGGAAFHYRSYLVDVAIESIDSFVKTASLW